MSVANPDHPAPADRLAGAPNFRAIAPLPAAGGARLRAARVFRSDALHRLTDEDLDRLPRYRIDTVLDLRRDDERARMPSRWPARAAPRTLTFDSPPELQAVQAGGWRPMIDDPGFGPDQARHWMAQTYRRMPRSLAPAVREALARVAAPPPGAGPATLLVHCTAGKDRTGFVCAMLLAALGVPAEAIMDDYLESSRRRPPDELAAALIAWSGIRPSANGIAAIEAIASVRPEYLDAAHRQIEDDWGSVPAYLRTCGLDDTTRERLAAALLG